MTLRLIRRTALMLIALFAFAQASVAVAGCLMDRGSMAASQEMAADNGCDCPPADGGGPSAVCVSHCTADLQLFGQYMAPVVHAAPQHGVLVVHGSDRRLAVAIPYVPPPATPPRRILLHSFLI
jgi:hypothetical protein